MLNPFCLAARLAIAAFVITGYILVGVFEAIWYSYHGSRERIGSALGDTGRAVVAAIAAIFRK
jgi:hypothetical protein